MAICPFGPAFCFGQDEGSLEDGPGGRAGDLAVQSGSMPRSCIAAAVIVRIDQ
jgi:hypothetical protein